MQRPFLMLDARLVLPSSGGQREMAGTRPPAEGEMNLPSRKPRVGGRSGGDPEHLVSTSELRVIYEGGEDRSYSQ